MIFIYRQLENVVAMRSAKATTVRIVYWATMEA